MTHAQFLAALYWHGGPLPQVKHIMPVGVVVRLANGDVHLVGDVNRVGGSCDCCSSFHPRDVVAWAWLPGWPLDVVHQEAEVTA